MTSGPPPALPSSGGVSTASRSNSDLSLVQQIDNQVVQGSPQQALQWLQVRREVLAQDSEYAEGRHRRRGEMLALGSKVGLSFAGLATGVGLIVFGAPGVGLICLGAAFYPLAPKLIESIFSSNKSDSDE